MSLRTAMPAQLQSMSILPALFDDGFDGAPAIGGAADVALQESRRAAVSFDFGGGFASLCLVDVEHSDECAHLGQTKRDAAPNAGSSAGDHRDLALQREELRRAFFDFRLHLHRESDAIESVPLVKLGSSV